MTEILPVANTYTLTHRGLFDEHRALRAAPAGFQRFFNSPYNNSETEFNFGNEAFERDVIRASDEIAAMVPRGITGKIIEETEERIGEFSSFSRTFPLARKIGNIYSNDLLKRVPGESPYKPLSKEDRMMILASRMHEDQIRKLVKLMEYLSAQMILTGKMPAILGTSDEELIYNFYRNTENSIAVNEYWNTEAGDPLADLDEACDAVEINGNTLAEMAIMGEDAMKAYLNNAKVQAWYDKLRMELGVIRKDMALPDRLKHFTGPGGFQFRGMVTTPKGRDLYLFTYLAHYEYPKGTILKYMPKDQVSVASPTAMCSRTFGPGEALPNNRVRQMWMEDTFGFSEVDMPLPENVEMTDNVIMPEMFHFRAFPSEDETSVRIVTEIAPVFGTDQTDGFSTITGTYEYP